MSKARKTAPAKRIEKRTEAKRKLERPKVQASKGATKVSADASAKKGKVAPPVAAKKSPFVRTGRRGRRPKTDIPYTPNNQDEPQGVPDSQYEGFEYDTGIRVNKDRDDAGFNFERAEDYDEELNFDW